MKYWIFSVAPYKSDVEQYTARQIYEQRMKDKFWGLGEKTANRKNVKKGDQVVFYVGRTESAFAGTAILASDSFTLNSNQKNALSHSSEFFSSDYGVLLDSIDIWGDSHPMKILAPNLDFIDNPLNWYAYLQGGIRQISEDDYAKIVNGILPSIESNIKSQVTDQSLFALEAHLEEFIDHNWKKIDWGCKLKLYEDGNQTGRQYPAGTWSIDFLSVDQNNGDFVVIELKRGKTSDATVGQALRYVNWVKINLAKPNQNVRCIIVANDIDDALRYATIGIPHIEVKKYVVSFNLNAVDLLAGI